MKKTGVLIGVLAIACALCACDQAGLRDEMARKDARLNELEQQIRDLEQKHGRELENKFSDLILEYGKKNLSFRWKKSKI